MICNSTHRLCLRIDETTGLSRRKRKFFKNDFHSFPHAACRDVSFLISSNIEARRGCWFIEDESAASIQIFEELSQILRVMCIMGFELLFRTLIETLTHKADGLTLIMISKKKAKTSPEICIFNLNWNRLDIFLMVSRINWKVHKNVLGKLKNWKVHKMIRQNWNAEEAKPLPPSPLNIRREKKTVWTSYTNLNNI